MKTTANVAGYGNLQVVSPYDIQTLQELQLVKKATDHAKLYLTGIIPEEKKDSYIAMATSSDIIEVNEVEDGRVVRNLFTGLIENIGVRAVRGIYYIELEGISLTSRLDIKEKTRSFQDKNMTYTALLDLILKDYPGSDYLDYATNGAKLEGFTLQYKETDWAFIKRMASRFGAVLLPETSSKTPKFSLGVPDGKLGQLQDYHYGVARSLDRYTEATTGHGSELDETAFTHYTTESGQYFALGDKVLFQEKELTVAASTARFTEGGLLYTYTLCQEEGVLQNPIRNEQLTGVSLEGKIIEIRRDTVKVHLDIDKTQDKSKAWWFPYSSVYSTEGADGFHCMPQEGDAVQVYFATSQEDGAVAMSSVRKTGQDSPKMGNPSEKYWGTNFGKEMKLGGSDFVLTAKDSKEGKMFIKLDVEDGIEIHSDKAIMFSAEKDLEIETDTKFEIKAQEAIYLLCKESSIVLDGETDIQGTVLKVDGLIKSPVSVADLEPEPEPEDPAPPPPPPEEEKGFWGSLLDGVQLALDVVGMIPVVGIVADVANAGISVARGDYAGAALSLAACIPFAGAAATGAKLGMKAAKALKMGKTVAKVADKAADVAKVVTKVADVVVGKVYTASRKLKSTVNQLAAVKKIKSSMKLKAMANSRVGKIGKAVTKEVATEAGYQVLEEVAGDVASSVLGVIGGKKNKYKGKKKLSKKERKKAAQRAKNADMQKANKKSCIGDPIHAGCGAQFIIHPTLKLYGAETWTFELHYNSLLLQQGVLGKAWTHNYEMHADIERIDQGEITIWWNTGRRNVFMQMEAENPLFSSEDVDMMFYELRRLENGFELFNRNTRETYYFKRNGQVSKQTNALGQALTFIHDSSNRLVKMTDVITGRSLSLTYGQDGLLYSVYDASRSVQFDYNESRRLSQFIDPNGTVSELIYTDQGQIESLTVNGIMQYQNTYDHEGRVIAQTNALGLASHFSYDTQSMPGSMITTFTDSLGVTEVLVHDERMLLLEKQEKDGSRVSYEYNDRGQMIAETVGKGETTTYQYDERGNLIQVVDPLGNQTSYVYSENDLLLSEINAEGGITSYTYDERERLVSITRSDESRSEIGYNEHGQRVSYTDSNGVRSRYQYDDKGLLTGVYDGEGRVIQVGYDEVGRIASFQDGRGGKVRRTYDANDNIVQVIDPLGRQYSFAYDAFDHRVEERMPSGAITRYRYHVLGSMESVTDALGQTTTYRYDTEGQLIAVIQPNEAEIHYERDQMGRIVSITDPLGRTEKAAYDETGRLLQVWDALGNKVQDVSYDAGGNLISATDALGHTTLYGFNKLYQCTKKTNALGQNTTYAYDTVARLIEVMENDAAIYRQQYDKEGHLISYTDANENETTLRYDQSGLVVEEQNATGEATHFAYDERGWMHKRTNARGQETHYRYDAAGQLIEQKDEVSTVRREYDTDGNLVTIQEEGAGAKHREYDLLGRVTACTDSYGNTIRYRYDENSQLTHLIYPDGKIVQYTYDLAGQLTEVKDWAGRRTTYVYDENGRLIKTVRPNGTIEQRSYDAAGQMLRLWDQNRQGVMLQKYRYVYNELGQIVQEEEKQYTYDALKRLVSGEWPGGRVWYSYDKGGNVTGIKTIEAASQKAMGYGKDNQLSHVNEQPVEMDADGNLLTWTENEETHTYVYDARNRLVRTGQAHYTYDAEYVRTSMTWKGKTTRYVVDQVEELSRVLMELGEDGRPKAYYVYGQGLIGREDAQGNYLSYHTDMRGSTTMLSDWSGRVTDRYSYGVYGELEQHDGTTSQPFCYNGRDGVMTDPNGLYYMRARYYHPGLKRFLNRDILAGDVTEGQTFNRFAYVNGDPVGFIDPLGLAGLGTDDCPKGNKGTGNDAYGGYYKRKQQRTSDYNNKTGKWSPAKKTTPPNGPYRTDKEADIAAEILGYKRVPEKSHGRAVYSNGKEYISPDTPRKTTGSTDNGGVWKKAKSPQDLISKDTRLGTYDKYLNRIGD
ncbi:toxin C-terminal domain-containing protein [Brevibacillus sp. VP]|uniref:toxin C-terminal domain-containing protein n=1 Tax=unclassified Brevibacillus TaxID=2684853 RepID=UPI000E2F7EBD|nr:RHS repeat-associated core domain-containing protein [Brevibacillus sp. VP]RFB33046.1 wall-associated protein [Brevibacillus sp. VP]